MRSCNIRALIPVFTAILFSFFAATAFAATFTVNDNGNASDVNNGDGICEVAATTGVCTLRAAIEEANALAGADIINFSITGTITLSTQLSVSSDLTINGPGAGSLTISGNNASRIFNVGAVTLSLSGLTIANGNGGSGAGILNAGTMTISNSTISGNSAGLGSGGGIFNNTGSTVTISKSTISGNSGAGGGGISNNGTLTISNSTLSGNSASIGQGGGIFNDTVTTVTISNSTLSGNSANSFGGGIYNFNGTVTISNSILAKNTGLIPDAFGTFTSLGHNLIGDTTGNSGWVASDLTGTAATPLDPKLGALANNGGPTQTRALLRGSPALQAADDTICTASPISGLDQRGVSRSGQGAHCDIGAFESRLYDLTVAAANTGSGTMNDSTTGGTIACTSTAGSTSGTCTENAPEGTAFTVVATASAGSSFQGWTGCNSTSQTNTPNDTCNVTLAANTTITAAFVPVYTLTVAGAGAGAGAMGDTSNILINCSSIAGVTSGDCSEVANQGSPFSIIARPAPGSVFTGWTGCNSTSMTNIAGDTCYVDLESDRTITATFALVFTLTVSGSGAGNGTMADSTPGGTISCTSTAGSTSGDCTQIAVSGTSFVVVATASSGSQFNGWTGCDSTSTTTVPGDTCTVALSSDKTITAAFVLLHTLTVAGSGAGNGTMADTTPGGTINCTSTAGSTSGDCTQIAVAGTSFVVVATASAGSQFNGWSGCNSTSTTTVPGDTCTVALSSDKTITAAFVLLHTLTVAGSGAGNGTMADTTPGGTISCTSTAGSTSGDCTQIAVAGTSFVVVATASAGSKFNGWTGCGSTSTTTVSGDTCTVALSSDKTITAAFVLLHTLTVAGAGTGNGAIADTTPGGTINCTSTAGVTSGDCTEIAVSGTSFVLVATPSSGSYFVSWTNCDSTSTTTVTGDTCTVALSSDKTVTATFNLSPDLQIAKDDGGITVRPGDIIVYTLTYSDSVADAAGVVISETVPADTKFNAGASTAGWSCADASPATTACDFTVGTVTAGSGGSVLFAVTVDAPVSQGTTTITNTATIADDGTQGTDPTPANNSATDTTPLVKSAQTVAVDPLGRFVIYGSAASACSTDLLFYQMLDTLGNPIGQPLALIPCGLLAGNALGIDIFNSNPNNYWLSFTGSEATDGKYLMQVDFLGNILKPAKQVVPASVYGSTVGATALAPKGCCKLFLYAPGAGGSILNSKISLSSLTVLKTKKNIATTPQTLSLQVTQRSKKPAFLALAYPDRTFRAYELNGKGLVDGITWRLSPHTDGAHELGSVSADGLAALSNEANTPSDQLYLQMLGTNGRPQNDPVIIAIDAISAADISNTLSSSRRYAVYATDDGRVLLQVVDAVTGSKLGSAINVK